MIWIVDELTKLPHCRLRCFEQSGYMTEIHPPRLRLAGYYVGNQAQKLCVPSRRNWAVTRRKETPALTQQRNRTRVTPASRGRRMSRPTPAATLSGDVAGVTPPSG